PGIAVITKHAPSCSSCQLITSGQATPRPLSQMRRSRSPASSPRREAGAIFAKACPSPRRKTKSPDSPPLTGNQSECDSPKKILVRFNGGSFSFLMKRGGERWSHLFEQLKAYL